MMKTMLKCLFLLILLLGAILVIVFRPVHVDRLEYRKQFAKIQRDLFNIPEINASTYQTALYAWGYVLAEDRLFQMAFKRIIVQGRLAEYLGQRVFKVDKYMREVNLRYWANRTAQKLKKQNFEEFQNYQAYADGINDCVSNMKALPLDFHLIGLEWEPWTVEDIFSLYNVLKWSQAFNAADEFIRSHLLSKFSKEEVDKLLPYEHQDFYKADRHSITVQDQELPEHLKTINLLKQEGHLNFTPVQIDQIVKVGLMEYLDIGRGSNGWVISGNHTKSGHPIIANDPHLDNHMPSEWYQIRLNYAERNKFCQLIVVVMPGVPLFIGKSSYAAISLTTMYADTQDLYRERVEDQKYLYDGKWIPLKKRIETIKVKGQAASEYVVYETHRGPIMSFIGHTEALYETLNQSISLIWTGYNDEYSTLTNFTRSGELQSLEELKDLLISRSSYGPSANLLYSTNDGHIGYATIGSFPLRKNVLTGMYIKDGTTSQHDWIGLTPSEDKLNIHDPEKGYIISANNKPASPHYYHGILGYNFYTARATRIEEMIKQKIANGVKITTEHVKQMQLDTVDINCRQFLPSLLQTLPATDKYLSNFDCNFTSQSYQATIYERLMYELYVLTNPEPEVKFNIANSPISYDRYYLYIEGARHSKEKLDVLHTAFEKTIANLIDFYDTDNIKSWKWGKYHQDVLYHRPFSNVKMLKRWYERKFEGRGNVHSVNVGKMNKLYLGNFDSNHRANMRYIGNHHQDSWWIVDSGSSQKFFSKHYDDQFAIFTQDKYIRMERPSTAEHYHEL